MIIMVLLGSLGVLLAAFKIRLYPTLKGGLDNEKDEMKETVS